jgi:hypothetical protein
MQSLELTGLPGEDRAIGLFGFNQLALAMKVHRRL